MIDTWHPLQGLGAFSPRPSSPRGICLGPAEPAQAPWEGDCFCQGSVGRPMATGGAPLYLALPDEAGANTKALLERQEPLRASDAARLETIAVQFTLKQHLELTGEQWAVGTLQDRDVAVRAALLAPEEAEAGNALIDGAAAVGKPLKELLPVDAVGVLLKAMAAGEGTTEQRGGQAAGSTKHGREETRPEETSPNPRLKQKSRTLSQIEAHDSQVRSDVAEAAQHGGRGRGLSQDGKAMHKSWARADGQEGSFGPVWDTGEAQCARLFTTGNAGCRAEGGSLSWQHTAPGRGRTGRGQSPLLCPALTWPLPGNLGPWAAAGVVRLGQQQGMQRAAGQEVGWLRTAIWGP